MNSIYSCYRSNWIICQEKCYVFKVSADLLVIAMVLFFVINFDKVESVLKITTWFSNVTVLYFVSLVLFVVGFASVAKLKK